MRAKEIQEIVDRINDKLPIIKVKTENYSTDYYCHLVYQYHGMYECIKFLDMVIWDTEDTYDREMELEEYLMDVINRFSKQFKHIKLK